MSRFDKDITISIPHAGGLGIQAVDPVIDLNSGEERRFIGGKSFRGQVSASPSENGTNRVIISVEKPDGTDRYEMSATDAIAALSKTGADISPLAEEIGRYNSPEVADSAAAYSQALGVDVLKAAIGVSSNNPEIEFAPNDIQLAFLVGIGDGKTELSNAQIVKLDFTDNETINNSIQKLIDTHQDPTQSLTKDQMALLEEFGAQAKDYGVKADQDTKKIVRDENGDTTNKNSLTTYYNVRGSDGMSDVKLDENHGELTKKVFNPNGEGRGAVSTNDPIVKAFEKKYPNVDAEGITTKITEFLASSGIPPDQARTLQSDEININATNEDVSKPNANPTFNHA